MLKKNTYNLTNIFSWIFIIFGINLSHSNAVICPLDYGTYVCLSPSGEKISRLTFHAPNVCHKVDDKCVGYSEGTQEYKTMVNVCKEDGTPIGGVKVTHCDTL